MSSPPIRSLRKLLVVNRGEIAVRVLSAARELDIETYAVYTEKDELHTYNAPHSIRLPSPKSYVDISHLIQIINDYSIDAVHPGYGFLSESADFAERVTKETKAIVIGPGAEILNRTADKLLARRLAERCRVPTLPALLTPTQDLNHIHQFAEEVGYPIMIKALDGGGGRGIRLVSNEQELPGQLARAMEESPSRQVFAEKAAAEGFHHIEIQIVGDHHGNVTHLHERDCSTQRRYQKVVEMAPSMLKREFVGKIIGAAMKMAKEIQYISLGTFEFLANPQSEEYFFLEVNPRLQVEHTVTESITGTDLVQAQIQIAQGATLEEAGLLQATNTVQLLSPGHCSLQLRITAEDVNRDWSLSVGKIQSFHFPSGNGIRVDTNLVQGVPAIIGSDFDSLVAKLIITASNWHSVVQKAKRALGDTRITGIKTNLNILRAIVAQTDFAEGRCDTSWLQKNNAALLDSAHLLSRETATSQDLFKSSTTGSSTSTNLASSASLFRKGDAWTLSLVSTPPTTSSPVSSPTQKPQHEPSNEKQQEQTHHLEIDKVLRNDFPTIFSADITLTSQASTPQQQQQQQQPQKYTIHLESTSSASAAALNSTHRRGSPKDPSHIIIPFAGKLVEFLVDVGDVIERGQVVCVVKQMKMELEVRAPKAGTVTWVTDAEDDEDVAEGTLAAIVIECGDKVGAKL